MKKFKNIIFGLALIAFGVIIGLNALGYTNIDIFFDGWWTLLLIVPCAVNLFTGKDPWSNLAGISVGTVILLICQGIITARTVLRLIFPIVLVCVGLYIVFKNIFPSKAAMRIKELNRNSPSHKGSYATFSSQNLNFAGETFTGTDLTAVFGSINCDLLFANVNTDCVINVSPTFGSIKIILPPNVNVVVRTTSVFGGVNRKRSFAPIAGAPTVFVNATCVFGGVELK